MKASTSVNTLLHSESAMQSKISTKFWDGTTFYWNGEAQNGKRHRNFILTPMKAKNLHVAGLM